MKLIELLKDEQGATGIEYAFVATLVSTAGLAAMSSLGDQVLDHYEWLVDETVAATSAEQPSQ